VTPPVLSCHYVLACGVVCRAPYISHDALHRGAAAHNANLCRSHDPPTCARSALRFLPWSELARRRRFTCVTTPVCRSGCLCLQRRSGLSVFLLGSRICSIAVRAGFRDCSKSPHQCVATFGSGTEDESAAIDPEPAVKRCGENENRKLPSTSHFPCPSPARDETALQQPGRNLRQPIFFPTSTLAQGPGTRGRLTKRDYFASSASI